jgi:hypothetical protein
VQINSSGWKENKDEKGRDHSSGPFLMCAAAVASGAEIKLSDLEGTPNVYCRVVKEPNPALLGHF